MKFFPRFELRSGWLIAASWCLALGLAACATEPVEQVEMREQTLVDPPFDTICGDGICSGGETLSNCPEDCSTPPACPDGICNGNETPATCPADCPPPPPECGDGVCTPPETAATCAIDCVPATCGDCICSYGETTSCPWDCNVPGYPSWCIQP